MEVDIAFHMGQDDGITVGAKVLDGVADLLFRGLWRELDEDGHGLVQGGDIAFIQEAGGGFGVEDFGADVEFHGWCVFLAPGDGFLEAGEVLFVGEGLVAGGDVGGADEVGYAGVRGLAEKGVHVVVVFGTVIYISDHVGVHFYEHLGASGFLALSVSSADSSPRGRAEASVVHFVRFYDC